MLSGWWKRWLCGVVIALLVQIVVMPHTAVRAQSADAPVVGGAALTRTTAGPVEVFHDADVDEKVIDISRTAILDSLEQVPRHTGLPRFATRIRAFILSDDERFRLALAEVASVRTELVSEDIGGYTIERDGVMLVFFGAVSLTDPGSALLGFSHEFAHLAVREASQRRAVPQWFNEGYASWIATKVVAERFPYMAGLQDKLDRASVASALHTRGLIPWAELVTRVRFSRAGVDGLGGLAYGQSTLFIDFLAHHHGRPALAKFLTTLGEGTGATQSFAAAFGPFQGQSSAFEASLSVLKTDVPQGLYVLQTTKDAQFAVFGLVGSPPLGTSVVRLMQGDETIRRRELEADGAGLLIFSLPKSLLDEQPSLHVVVTSPTLGELELDLLTQERALPSTLPRPERVPVPAPAQLPAA